MKKILVAVFAVAVFAGISGGAWAQTSTDAGSTKASTGKSMVGTISSDGTSFTRDSDSKMYKIENPDAVKGHEGHHVSVSAKTNSAGDGITVNSLKMVKAKSASSPGGSM